MVRLIPWSARHELDEPVSMLTRFRSEMDRLFDRFFETPFSALEAGPWTRVWTPLMDIDETDNQIIVTAEVPGMDPNEIDITVSGRELTISGEKRFEQERQERGVYHCERRYGSFRRTLELPSEVEADKVSASYDNGVLKIQIPKSQAQQPKRIPVQVGSGRRQIGDGQSGRGRMEESSARAGQNAGSAPAGQAASRGGQGGSR